MKRITNLIFFALLAITSYSQVANPTYWERKQYGSNWLFDYDTVRVNRLMVDQKLCIDSLGTIVYYNNALPAAKMLMVGNGTRFTTLAGGTALQYLRVNAAGTALEYATLDAGDLGGFTDTYILVGQPDGTAGGDNSFMWDGSIMTCLGTGYFDDGVNIGGTSGFETKFDDEGRIEWYHGLDVVAGDLLYGTNGGGYYAALGLGTSEQVLRVKSDGSNVEWADLSYAAITDFVEGSQDAVLPCLYSVIFDYDDPTDFVTLKDRDAGDITLSGGFGVVWTVDNLAITDAKINDVALSKVTGLGTNIATFLATPSSANERAALTDENGTGADLFDGASGVTLAGTTALATATLSGKVTTYNGITTANNGVLSSVGTPVHLTGQTAAIAATTCYTADADGFYQVCWSAAITTAATSSSTLGHFQVRYTNVADNVVKTSPTQNNVTASAANVTTGTGSSINGVFTVYAKSGTAIQYIMGYTSSGATAMQYSLDITVVKL